VCAHAVRVALLKVAGVESVDVSLERATAAIRLRAGNSVTLAQIREIVKNNGFTAKEADVTVVGSLVERGGKPALAVSGTNVVLLLAPDSKQPDTYEELTKRLPGTQPGAIELRGTVESRPDQPDMLVVRTASALPR
jgi:copper chaperone CopZ